MVSSLSVNTVCHVPIHSSVGAVAEYWALRKTHKERSHALSVQACALTFWCGKENGGKIVSTLGLPYQFCGTQCGDKQRRRQREVLQFVSSVCFPLLGICGRL